VNLWLDHTTVQTLRRKRKAGEWYSETILKLAKVEKRTLLVPPFTASGLTIRPTRWLELSRPLGVFGAGHHWDVRLFPHRRPTKLATPFEFGVPMAAYLLGRSTAKTSRPSRNPH
jgi:hypothetical protein